MLLCKGAVGQLLFCCVLCEARKGEVTAHPNWHPCLAICGLKSEWIVRERQWVGMGGVATNNSVLGVRGSVVYCPCYHALYHEHLLLCV